MVLTHLYPQAAGCEDEQVIELSRSAHIAGWEMMNEVF
jgi:hypothetical protein